MKPKPITIKDIASELNMNVSTVSRALNDHPAISKETKQLVVKTAKKLNYRVNTIASNLRKGKGKTIGLLVPQINRQFFANVINGVETIANENGYSTIICQSKESYQKEVEAIHTLLENRVDGIILSISKETETYKHLQNLLDQHLPIIQFDRIAEHLETHRIVNDNMKGGAQAVTYLLEEGYRSIVHYAGPQTINIYRDRCEGYKNAMREHGLEKDIQIFEDVLTEEIAYQKTMELSKSLKKPAAIFAASDFGALGTLHAAKALNVDVPQELGIVGFANEPFTALTFPGITTFDQYSEEMGRVSARILLEELKGEKTGFIPKTMILQPKLIVRSSSNRNQLFQIKTQTS